MDDDKLLHEIKRSGLRAAFRDIQAEWFAAQGWGRRKFIAYIVITLLVMPIAVWIAYLTDYDGSIDKSLAQSDNHTFAMLMLMVEQIMYWICLIVPWLMLAAFAVAALTGMFTRSFWLDVDRLRRMKTAGQ